MKKVFILSVAVLLGTSAVVSSCSKYEEGPKLTLLSKKSRLTGDWKLSEQTLNGTAQTLNGTSTMTISKDGTFKSAISYVLLGQTYSSNINGTWEFSDDKTSILSIPSGQTTVDTLKIYRLANKELKFIDVNGSNTTISTYVPQ
jgi:hypothetical protein